MYDGRATVAGTETKADDGTNGGKLLDSTIATDGELE
jgi:hypothetical protein